MRSSCNMKEQRNKNKHWIVFGLQILNIKRLIKISSKKAYRARSKIHPCPHQTQRHMLASAHNNEHRQTSHFPISSTPHRSDAKPPGNLSHGHKPYPKLAVSLANMRWMPFWQNWNVNLRRIRAAKADSTASKPKLSSISSGLLRQAEETQTPRRSASQAHSSLTALCLPTNEINSAGEVRLKVLCLHFP